jgi:ABC-type sugar transport system substrate-binding protein
MEDILQTDPDLDAVFAANDQMALGAIQAIAAHDKTDQIKLIGFDGALEATQHILAGDMQATVAQDPYGMAKQGVEQALAKLRGKPVKRTIDTGAKLITPENAEEYFEEVRGKLGGTGRGLDG